MHSQASSCIIRIAWHSQGLLKRWDATSPVHLVGHSFGGNTAVALYNMIAEDHWGLGTGPDWVVSVTAICAPLRGCLSVASEWSAIS